jgi:sugar phosphate isomerase/epimerase
MPRFPLAFITDEFTQDFELACRTAQELGYQGLEVRTAWDKNIVDLADAHIAGLRRLADAHSLRILSIASPVFKCTHPEGGAIDHRFEQDAFQAAHRFEDQDRVLRRAIQVALALNAPIIRVFSFWRTVEPQRLFGHIVAALAPAVDLAARHNLRIGLENEHACNIATAAEAAPVLRALDASNLGLVWDPGNSYMAGATPFPDDYSLVPVSRIVHVHAKDGVRSAAGERVIWGPLGEGRVRWQEQIRALARDGYQGAISIETHWTGPDGNKFEGSRICAQHLKRMVEAAG